MKDISLIGFMGCGKSSVGKILATLLPECRLIDLDTYIEEKQGKNIPEIFNEYGEAAFRRMEREALEEIFSDKSRPRAILSLGGGTVTSEQCRQLIRQHTDCFYLRATTDTLLDNLEGNSDGRPMLNPTQPVEAPSTEVSSEREALRHRIESLMQTRSPQYLATANHIIDIDGLSFTQIAEAVEDNILNIKQQSICL
ncbi:MAG: shikimate kinase [Bacteroidales bacterium]|nr:shikimate kinase [Bacteroidales bacterium]